MPKIARPGRPVGWFSEADAHLYCRAVSAFQDGSVVEVGTWLGRSLSVIAEALRTNRQMMWCVDIWDPSVQTKHHPRRRGG